MSPRGFDSLMATLIRIGLLLALLIMLMAENAHAQPSLIRHARLSLAIHGKQSRAAERGQSKNDYDRTEV
jgi:hypothetical protein